MEASVTTKYATDRGRTITAPTLEAAEALAAQYGMGTVTGKVAAAPKPARMAVTFVVMDDLTQSEEFRGDLEGAAQALYYGRDSLTVMALTARGYRALNRAEVTRLRQIMEDAG